MSTNTAPTITETAVTPPTDKEKVMALFTELGIGFKQDKTSNCLNCESGDPKIGGYSNFQTQFEFDDTGKFMSMNLWEI